MLTTWFCQEDHSPEGAPDGPSKLVLKLYLLTHARWPNPIKLPVPLGPERDLSKFTSNKL